MFVQRVGGLAVVAHSVAAVHPHAPAVLVQPAGLFAKSIKGSVIPQLKAVGAAQVGVPGVAAPRHVPVQRAALTVLHLYRQRIEFHLSLQRGAAQAHRPFFLPQFHRRQRAALGLPCHGRIDIFLRRADHRIGRVRAGLFRKAVFDMQDILSGEHDPQHALAGLCEFRAARHLPDLIPTIAHFNRPFGR